MRALDTNVLVRYLAQDDRAQAAVATRLIETELTDAAPGYVALVTLCELAWVLESAYAMPVTGVAAILERLLSISQLTVEQAPIARDALTFYRTTPADFADAVMALLGRDAGCSAFVTFDRGCAKLPGARVLRR